MFDRQLVQAVSDWQRGFTAKQKVKRAEALKAAVSEIDEQYRRVEAPCYRQISLDPAHVWKLGDNLHLVESVSSWTTSADVAEKFKGGVPPPGWQGVIVRRTPADSEVVVNLERLFADALFRASVEHYKADIDGFYDGIGRYGADQREVVLDVETVPLDSVEAVGGYSSSREELAAVFFGRTPNANDLAAFDVLVAERGWTIGAVWLRGPGMQRSLETMVKFVEQNRDRHL